MVVLFKQKLMIENCFHVNFSVQKVGGTAFPYFKIGKELIIGFVRDHADDNEFFFEIKSKEKNTKSGEIDQIRIPVCDIDDIEHEDGTLQFYLHFRAT